ncbi:MAG TPA: hypothetical protein VFK04_03715 [Gemmatimonadaceae bacterium]|nr:hypothetical protein [Gemmatimonadaceae bacterium]
MSASIIIPATGPAGTISQVRARSGSGRPSYVARATGVRGERDAVLALVMDRVHKSFGAGVRGCGARVRVLAGASLVVGVGEIVGVAGGAGEGKSTLLVCAAGSVRVERGSVSWPARSTGACGEGARRRLYLDLRDTRQCREIERAVAGGVPLLLLDHATPAILDELRAVVARMPRPLGSAILVAGRSGAELARVASRVLVLREGRVHAAGSVAGERAAAPQRKRSAARASSEFPSALARARIRST